MEEKVARGIQSPRTLINNVLQINPEAGHTLEEVASSFKPNIIVNQTRRHDDHELGTDIVQACQDYFGINIRSVGHIDADDSLREAVRLRKAAVDSFPLSSFSRSIHSIVKNLLGVRNGPT
jgi:flagellar biosynthesis protein FlhG